jgi:hypothetical protein
MLTPRHLGALTATACLVLCLAPAAAGARGPCAPRPVRTRLVHHVAPPQKFLSALSVLRRPQTSADLQGFNLSEPALGGLIGVQGVGFSNLDHASVIEDADYIRKLGSVGGQAGA